MRTRDPELVSSTEAARILGVSKMILFKRLRRGEIQGVKSDNGWGTWLIPRASVEATFPQATKPPGPGFRQLQRLNEAADRYEHARDELAREPTGGAYHSDLWTRRNEAEAALLDQLGQLKAVHHHAGRAYWCHDGELHRAESRSFRSQTP